MSGTYGIPAAALFDRELSAQTGRSLRQWAEDHGIPLASVLYALDGQENEELFRELAGTLGISVASIRDICAIRATG